MINYLQQNIGKIQAGGIPPIGIDPQMLSQMMSAQGAGQGIDYNGEPTPNVSGEPSFADMAQAIQERYDKLIIPLQRKLEKLKAKLKENPTDQTIKNEIQRLEQRIDQFEQQEDMELQQLEAEVEKSGEMIEQQKQMEGYADMNIQQTEEMQEPASPDMEQMMMPDGSGEMPMMQFGGNVKKKQNGNEAWERSNTVTLDPVTVRSKTYSWPYFAKNPLFAPSQMPKVWQLPEMSNGLPKFKLPDVTSTMAATTPTSTTTNTTPTTTENADSRKKWWQPVIDDLRERPLSDYLQGGIALSEMLDSFAPHMANALLEDQITGNPYRRNIDSAMQAKNDAVSSINRYFDTQSALNRRDLNRMLSDGQYGSLAQKTAYNNAVYSKFNEYLEKMNASREENLAKVRSSYDELIDKAHTQYNQYEEGKDMYNKNNRRDFWNTLSENHKMRIQARQKLGNEFAKATQDQRDFNFITGDWTKNYKNLLAAMNFFRMLTPEQQKEIMKQAEGKTE